MSLRNGRSLITGGPLGHFVQTSVKNSLGGVGPSLRKRTVLKKLLRSLSTCKICLNKVRPYYVIGGCL